MSHPFGKRVTRRPARSPGYVPTREPRTLSDLLALHERIIIIEALQRNGGSRKRAAAGLGISPLYLWRRMRLLNIDFSAVPRTTGGRPKKKFT